MKQDILNRNDIESLINSFYTKVQNDATLGYVFNDVAKVDWEHHLPQMYDFWDSLIFGHKAYSGNPMRKHLDLHKKSPLTQEQFEHWLQLFDVTVDELYIGNNANRIKDYASTIKDNLLNRVVLSVQPNIIK